MRSHHFRLQLSAAFVASLVFPSLCLALTPTMKATVETPQRPVVVGETNLPDGTDLLITISRRESKYQGQSKVKVSGGRFHSEQFGQGGGDLNPGKYNLEIIMPVAQVQPSSVQAVIGEKGEKLAGPLVDRGGIGPSVRYVTTFQNGGASNAKADSAARAKEKENRAKWVIESCNDLVKRFEPTLGPEQRQHEIDQCISGMKSKKR